MTEQVSRPDIIAMALEMYSHEEMDLMSREQIMSIFTLARANVLEPKRPTRAELQHQREVLERSLLHPAIEAWRAENRDGATPAKVTAKAALIARQAD